MREKDQKRIGLYVLLINIMLLLFLITSKEFDDSYLLVGGISSFIAILINYQYFMNYKNKYNLISLILNILILNGIIVLFIIKHLN